MSPERAVRRRAEAPRAVSLHQWTLTRADLDAMPNGLRRGLLRYLEKTEVAARAEPTGSPLGRNETAALLRQISFDRAGRSLRSLLDCFALEEPTTRRRLAQALPPADRDNLGRHLAKLNRMAAKATGSPGMRLWHFHRREALYSVHPSVRKWLRRLLPGIEHAGEHEEPLWE